MIAISGNDMLKRPKRSKNEAPKEEEFHTMVKQTYKMGLKCSINLSE
jgi:hypothetical protein